MDRKNILETIRSPKDIKDLDVAALRMLADEIRAFLLDSISRTGGHIGANLGTVELSIALHKVFESPAEPIIWDTGHQGYTHKLLTGRAGLFPSLNSFGGMNRFVTRTESEHDLIEASHAGTSLSVALGMALARKIRGEDRPVVAFIGDGALAEGMALEALNHAAVENAPMVLALNDNGFAISPGFGAMHEAFQHGRARALFEALGCRYIGPVDGHDVAALVEAFTEARKPGPLAVVHAKTEKGHGWEPAKTHPVRQHFSFPFDVASGTLSSGAPPKPCQDVAAAEIAKAMETDERICCVTPSTLYATGLAPIFQRWPERCFDPGMEEQHAMTLTVGLALDGMRPVIAYQSTFMQRAFDQVIHDVCFMNLPILMLGMRSGFAGYDNPTHHGIYDLAYLRPLPNLTMLYPKDGFELAAMVAEALRNPAGPTLILMPYGPVDEIDPTVADEPPAALSLPQVVCGGKDVTVFTVGNTYKAAVTVVEELRAHGVDAGLVNLRRLKPLPEDELAALLAAAPRAVTIEEAVLDGGVGSALATLAMDRRIAVDVLRIGIPCTFAPPGSNDELTKLFGLDAPGIAAKIAARWPEWAK